MTKLEPRHTALNDQAPENAQEAQASSSFKGSTTQLDLSPERWIAEKNLPHGRWRDSLAGRGAIRIFSRGILGATGFALGGAYASKAMHNYNPKLAPQNLVQGIAKAYDVTFGKGLESLVNALGHDGKAFVTFRPERQFPGYAGRGRSLGHEVVNVTFDFASMSVGDYWGRIIAGTLDPHRTTDWINQDGSFNPKKALNAFARNLWASTTYAAGEDWFVAVPYVMSMKFISTPMIEKMYPGYRYDFAHTAHGGSVKVDAAGKIMNNFTTAGALNLWERFTTYNVGTLIYREGYSWAGDQWQKIKRGTLPSFTSSDKCDTPDGSLEPQRSTPSQFGHWLARSALKATAYMIPAVPFFWVARVPQNKYRGLFIHPEKGFLNWKNAEGAMQPLRLDDWKEAGFDRAAKVFFSETGESAANPFMHNIPNPNSQSFGVTDTLLNPVAKLAQGMRDTLREPIASGFEKTFGKQRLRDTFGVTDTKRQIADTYLNAAMAYTPYFWAKSDVFAHAWDTGRTDTALDRIVDGAVSMNGREVKEGLNEFTYAIRNEPLPDPKREAIAQCRIAEDISPADSHTFEEAEDDRMMRQEQILSGTPQPQMIANRVVKTGTVQDLPAPGSTIH